MSAIETALSEDDELPEAVNPAELDTAEANRYRLAILERMEDSRDLLKLINQAGRLSDSEIEDRLNTVGWIAANWYQRKAALTGDINTARACDIYLKRCDEWRARRNSRQPKPTPDADSKPFLRAK